MHTHTHAQVHTPVGCRSFLFLHTKTTRSKQHVSTSTRAVYLTHPPPPLHTLHHSTHTMLASHRAPDMPVKRIPRNEGPPPAGGRFDPIFGMMGATLMPRHGFSFFDVFDSIRMDGEEEDDDDDLQVHLSHHDWPVRTFPMPSLSFLQAAPSSTQISGHNEDDDLEDDDEFILPQLEPPSSFHSRVARTRDLNMQIRQLEGRLRRLQEANEDEDEDEENPRPCNGSRCYRRRRSHKSQARAATDHRTGFKWFAHGMDMHSHQRKIHTTIAATALNGEDDGTEALDITTNDACGVG
ncbi:hypothetical protein PTSG_07392 [Salpingoeca rosetta]|uniref:Uncharacterized protein n=1 Tax=Salpingoeca rosetta (strain ATCC 50818 / BSB-021) TaxID=946362 RepID=F2UIK2_SALR5|nr:uncharacterized protein PTSG_07392 [Salpingoeca rosetta]EGD77051.1 hypothetical protein PTSG_07392 [Salpingoeca rosetta]|eukprot:XP_004990891.1 hypothetical protein PTSG_07392 [Salpingoeca rosetta]